MWLGHVYQQKTSMGRLTHPSKNWKLIQNPCAKYTPSQNFSELPFLWTLKVISLKSMNSCCKNLDWSVKKKEETTWLLWLLLVQSHLSKV